MEHVQELVLYLRVGNAASVIPAPQNGLLCGTALVSDMAPISIM
jgi:hypothetical protein